MTVFNGQCGMQQRVPERWENVTDRYSQIKKDHLTSLLRQFSCTFWPEFRYMWPYNCIWSQMSTSIKWPCNWPLGSFAVIGLRKGEGDCSCRQGSLQTVGFFSSSWTPACLTVKKKEKYCSKRWLFFSERIPVIHGFPSQPWKARVPPFWAHLLKSGNANRLLMTNCSNCRKWSRPA